MIIFRPFAPGVRVFDQFFSIDALSKLEDEYTIRHHCCRGDLDYGRGLASLWKGQDDILICEHDMAPSPDMVYELDACPYPNCAQAYYLYRPSVGSSAPVLAHRKKREDGRLSWIEPGDTFADVAAMGLTKIGKNAQSSALEFVLRQTSWNRIDVVVSTEMKTRWHIHWPVCVHHHT